MIAKYEWLGTLGNASHYVGLLAPNRELHGVACFGPAPGGIHVGGPALYLTRGACVHYAPRNAASFLINHACKLMCRETGVPLFFAYADPAAGEYGGVYQAANWNYLGQGIVGQKMRKARYAMLPPGADPDNPANWKTARELRRKNLTFGLASSATSITPAAQPPLGFLLREKFFGQTCGNAPSRNWSWLA